MSIIILGGGTFSDVTPHLSLCARAFGSTATQIYKILIKYRRDVKLVLTKMADAESTLVSNSDVSAYIDTVLADDTVKVIIFSAAMCDFHGYIEGHGPDVRLSSDNYYEMNLVPDTFKVLSKIKKIRPDIFLVGFKTTANETVSSQIQKARKQIDTCGCDIVFANDIATRSNMLVFADSVNMDFRDSLLKDVAAESLLHIMTGNIK